MQAQRYRHRVTFQEQVESQDSNTGDVTFEWVDFKADVASEVLTGPGREFAAANTKQAETTARINCNWFPGLTQKMRAVWDSRNFDIQEIGLDATARREYRLRCTDGVNNGV